jgi:hypothetical protein
MFLFTETEIRDAARRNFMPATADNLIESMKKNRASPQERVITQEELNAALKRKNYSADIHAQNLVDDVIAHREPEYIIGRVYRSDSERLYKRIVGGWVTFGDTRVFEYDYPTRPMHDTKLDG